MQKLELSNLKVIVSKAWALTLYEARRSKNHLGATFPALLKTASLLNKINRLELSLAQLNSAIDFAQNLSIYATGPENFNPLPRALKINDNLKDFYSSDLADVFTALTPFFYVAGFSVQNSSQGSFLRFFLLLLKPRNSLNLRRTTFPTKSSKIKFPLISFTEFNFFYRTKNYPKKLTPGRYPVQKKNKT